MRCTEVLRHAGVHTRYTVFGEWYPVVWKADANVHVHIYIPPEETFHSHGLLEEISATMSLRCICQTFLTYIVKLLAAREAIVCTMLQSTPKPYSTSVVKLVAVLLCTCIPFTQHQVSVLQCFQTARQTFGFVAYLLLLLALREVNDPRVLSSH